MPITRLNGAILLWALACLVGPGSVAMADSTEAWTQQEPEIIGKTLLFPKAPSSECGQDGTPGCWHGQVPGFKPVKTPDQMQHTMEALCQRLMDQYHQRQQNRINAQWKAPKVSGIQSPVIRYEITQGGQVKAVKVLVSSGNSDIDQAALAHLGQQDLSSEPLPACYGEPVLEVDHTFELSH